ncbi:TIM barrel protein [Candidatus Poribacteria bacterium]|jgi:sugar phosphate isomerase/epimerase|nr:TIM barrel protein [Candidatus Poribacteria bacterium]MBT5713304.1 TIM barrel protein [Candidatus Poribacteria bacterium]MBT7099422.1 TIM barrel protein [Candidatus Poribacteria bacterium]MBT7804284.1 TIM barrel protein [Candidatus Poribacteria bacterium]
MARAVTLFTGQWADLPLEELAPKAKEFGYDGIELACWGDHFEVDKALEDDGYCQSRWDILKKNGLSCVAISNHLVGQAMCDNIDARHEAILPPRIWGDGNPAGVQARACEEMADTARAAAKLGVTVVNGFTGSAVWPLLYSFPPNQPDQIDAGYRDFAAKTNPVWDVFDEVGVKFAHEVHPTEISFDIASAERMLDAVDNREAVGFNYDPSHLGYQGVDYILFIEKFRDRIYHAHMKDVWWSSKPMEAGVFGGHTEFGDRRRFWDFRSVGRGSIDFEEIIRALNEIGYDGPLSVEWEDSGMDREAGAAEAAAYLKKIDFKPSDIAFDAQFAE